MVLFVILKSNTNLSLLINLYFHIVNTRLQVLFMQKEISIIVLIQSLFRDSFSLLLIWANAIKVWANAIKVWAFASKVWANASKMTD